MYATIVCVCLSYFLQLCILYDVNGYISRVPYHVVWKQVIEISCTWKYSPLSLWFIGIWVIILPTNINEIIKTICVDIYYCDIVHEYVKVIFLLLNNILNSFWVTCDKEYNVDRLAMSLGCISGMQCIRCTNVARSMVKATSC